MTRVLYRTALAVLLAGNAAGLAVLVAAGHGIPPLLGAVALGYLGAVVLAYACGAAFHVGGAHGCKVAHERRWRPERPQVVPGVVIAEEQAGADPRHPLPQVPPRTMVYTAAMPTVGGVVGRFDAAVADAAPGVWTPPVGAAGRHAGAAASDLSEWGAFEYGGTR